jgi:hypothetical protein
MRSGQIFNFLTVAVKEKEKKILGSIQSEKINFIQECDF